MEGPQKESGASVQRYFSLLTASTPASNSSGFCSGGKQSQRMVGSGRKLILILAFFGEAGGAGNPTGPTDSIIWGGLSQSQ